MLLSICLVVGLGLLRWHAPAAEPQTTDLAAATFAPPPRDFLADAATYTAPAQPLPETTFGRVIGDETAPGRGGPGRVVRPRRPQVLSHTVVAGDTLWDIALAYGTDADTLQAINDLSRGRPLQIGQVIRVLTVPGLIHTVAAGDTVADLAERYAIAAEEIISANNLASDQPLSEGQELILPGAAAAGGPASPAGYIWPVAGPLTSEYGMRWGSMHPGIDIGAQHGDTVAAARDGWVEHADWLGGYGLTVIIDHGDGVRTLYAHHSRLLVESGQWVGQGEPVALVGSTGISTGPHLHFEIRLRGQALDPLEYLP